MQVVRWKSKVWSPERTATGEERERRARQRQRQRRRKRQRKEEEKGLEKTEEDFNGGGEESSMAQKSEFFLISLYKFFSDFDFDHDYTQMINPFNL